MEKTQCLQQLLCQPSLHEYWLNMFLIQKIYRNISGCLEHCWLKIYVYGIGSILLHISVILTQQTTPVYCLKYSTLSCIPSSLRSCPEYVFNIICYYKRYDLFDLLVIMLISIIFRPKMTTKTSSPNLNIILANVVLSKPDLFIVMHQKLLYFQRLVLSSRGGL